MRKILVIVIAAALGWISPVSAKDKDVARMRTVQYRSPDRFDETMGGVWRLYVDGRRPMDLEVWQLGNGRWIARTFEGDTLDRVSIDPRTGRFDFYELDAIGWQWYRGQVRNGRIIGRFSYYQDGPYYDPRTLEVIGVVRSRGPDPFSPRHPRLSSTSRTLRVKSSGAKGF